MEPETKEFYKLYICFLSAVYLWDIGFSIMYPLSEMENIVL